jgi:hypothetical protein
MEMELRLLSGVNSIQHVGARQQTGVQKAIAKPQRIAGESNFCGLRVPDAWCQTLAYRRPSLSVFQLQYHNPMIGSALVGSETIQGAADDRSGGIVAATVIIISISIVPVATTAINLTTAAIAGSARKMTSAITTTGVPAGRMSTHCVTADGMTTRGMPSAVTSTMSNRKGTSHRHATKGDCGSESN